MRPLYYDKQGEPISDVLEMAKLFEDMEYRRVAYDELSDGAYLSTVWLGIDHNHLHAGAPLIFETMAFPTERFDLCERYSTLAEALEGHARILADLRKPI